MPSYKSFSVFQLCVWTSGKALLSGNKVDVEGLYRPDVTGRGRNNKNAYPFRADVRAIRFRILIIQDHLHKKTR